MCICKKFRRSTEDVRTRRGADAAPDHHPLVGKFKLRLRRHHRAKSQRVQYNTEYLSNAQVSNKFNDILSRENTELQLSCMEGRTVNEWEHLKAAWSSTCEEELGTRTQKHKEWITPENLNTIQQRRQLKEKVSNLRIRGEKALAQREYNRCHKKVQKNIRRDKRTQVERLAEEAELGATETNMKELYTFTRKLSGHTHKVIN